MDDDDDIRDRLNAQLDALETEVAELLKDRDFYAGKYADKCGETIVLTAQVEEARNRALEEAARAVETHYSFPKPSSRAAQYYEREVLKPCLANAIRNLIENKVGGDG